MGNKNGKSKTKSKSLSYEHIMLRNEDQVCRKALESSENDYLSNKLNKFQIMF